MKEETIRSKAKGSRHKSLEKVGIFINIVINPCSLSSSKADAADGMFDIIISIPVCFNLRAVSLIYWVPLEWRVLIPGFSRVTANFEISVSC